MKTEICETTLETINIKKYCGQTSNKAGNVVRTIERIGVFSSEKRKIKDMVTFFTYLKDCHKMRAFFLFN